MKITVPDSLADITVKQYKLLAELNLDEKSTEWIVEAICIMCNLSKEETNQLTIPEMEKISSLGIICELLINYWFKLVN